MKWLIPSENNQMIIGIDSWCFDCDLCIVKCEGYQDWKKEQEKQQ